MIDPAQIPDEVVERLCEGLSYWDRETARAAIATAINAWPGAQESGMTMGPYKSHIYILPLPQEASDDQDAT